jgi:hypothetical protein
MKISSGAMLIGRITAAIPRIHSMLAISLPMIFPSAIVIYPFRAADTETNNSGSDVPIDMSKSAIRYSDTPKAIESPIIEFTRILAPMSIPVNPKSTPSIFLIKPSFPIVSIPVSLYISIECLR